MLCFAKVYSEDGSWKWCRQKAVTIRNGATICESCLDRIEQREKSMREYGEYLKEQARINAKARAKARITFHKDKKWYKPSTWKNS